MFGHAPHTAVPRGGSADLGSIHHLFYNTRVGLAKKRMVSGAYSNAYGFTLVNLVTTSERSVWLGFADYAYSVS